MEKNSSLSAAKSAKQDEFYIRREDIENELIHYKNHFRDKVVFCNCDDPYESNFFKFFSMHFNDYGLKRLIATCYDGSPIADQQMALFEPAEEYGGKKVSKTKVPHKIVINEVKDLNGDGAIDMTDIDILLQSDNNALTRLEGNGDFRSKECVELLKEADIIVTNPPFSLFREYVSQLMEYEKKFLIIGNQNAITYKEIFPLIKEDKLWLGYKSGDMAFRVPDYFESRETRYWQDDDGQKWRSMGNITWYTNLDHNKRHEKLDFIRRYNFVDYPKYDNYDAINVDKVENIPEDYNGVIMMTFAGTLKGWDNLSKEQQKMILDYMVQIYV